MKLDKAIKILRKRNNLTLDTLATRANLSKGLLSKIENGNGNPTLSTLCSIAEAFGLKLSELIRKGEA